MSLAKNYARALFEESRKPGHSKQSALEYKSELQLFWTAVSGSKEMMIALTAPVTSADEKTAIVQEVASRLKLSKLTVNFLSLLGQNRRLGELPKIIDAFDEVRLSSEGGLVGQIISAEPMDPAAIKEITDAFTQKLNKKVEFKASTDSSLLAGLKVTVNGVTYDGTLLSQLERLRESFVQGAGTPR